MRTFETIIICALVATSAAFSPVLSPRGIISAPRPLLSTSGLSATGDDESDLPPLPSAASAAPIEQTKPAVQSSTEEEAASYPLNFPSPLLLASSILLTIASTGSLFKMFDDPPQLGFATTAAAIGIEFVLAGYLFYAAILKATAETEEDDREFNKPRRL
mmetsp:Transcript_17334/g.39709  ORF Transcript_17334/g.39709 Transcript_17334/m.39709 type:complete len:160 (+) Transcript_17334:98-577(+)